MPGHVTKEGFKIGDGNCPYWSNISKLNAKKAEKKAVMQEMAGTVQVAQAPQLQASQAQPRVSPKAAAVNQAPATDVFIAQVGEMTVRLTRREALGLTTSLLVQLLARGE